MWKWAALGGAAAFVLANVEADEWSARNIYRCRVLPTTRDLAKNISVVTDPTCAFSGIGCITTLCRYCRVNSHANYPNLLLCSDVKVAAPAPTTSVPTPAPTTSAPLPSTDTPAPTSDSSQSEEPIFDPTEVIDSAFVLTCSTKVSSGDAAVGIGIITDVSCVLGGIGCLNDVCRYCQASYTTQSSHLTPCSSIVPNNGGDIDFTPLPTLPADDSGIVVGATDRPVLDQIMLLDITPAPTTTAPVPTTTVPTPATTVPPPAPPTTAPTTTPAPAPPVATTTPAPTTTAPTPVPTTRAPTPTSTAPAPTTTAPAPATTAPTPVPTTKAPSPTTAAPLTPPAPTTRAPTSAPTTTAAPPTTTAPAPTTKAPTTAAPPPTTTAPAPTTKAPTPTTTAPTPAPTTRAPTPAPTPAPTTKAPTPTTTAPAPTTTATTPVPTTRAPTTTAPATTVDACAASVSTGDASVGISAYTDTACAGGGLGCFNTTCRYCKTFDTLQSQHLLACKKTVDPCLASVSSGDAAVGISAVTDTTCQSGGLGCFSNTCRYCKTVNTLQSQHLLFCSAL